MKVAIYDNEDGGVSVVIPAPNVSFTEAVKNAVPEGVQFRVMNKKDLPEYLFRDAWIRVNKEVHINVERAKEKVHRLRRIAREEEFAPHDEIVMKQIPGKDAKKAEQERVKIRAKHAKIQDRIDACTSPDELKTIINEEKFDGLYV